MKTATIAGPVMQWLWLPARIRATASGTGRRRRRRSAAQPSPPATWSAVRHAWPRSSGTGMDCELTAAKQAAKRTRAMSTAQSRPVR
ncbi:hypothetical protein [Streptomyces erythrochromogenes]|uniref:hypothetical protein n=1 Tax=Streptomyces erythrochromogenes TaxID=285574 RepID=UPI0036F8A9A4